MKRVLNIFFVTLGVIFFCIMLAGVYFYVTDPLGLKPIFFDNMAREQSPETGAEGDRHPLLSESQERALETFGIDPASLPSEITPAQEACFEETLGEERVAEIKAGDTPTAAEYYRARACI